MTLPQFLILLTLFSGWVLMLWMVIYLWSIPKSFKEDAKVQREIDKLELAHGEYMVEQMKKFLNKEEKCQQG